jgi:hypothetical protein
VTTTSLHEGLDWVYKLDSSYCIFYIKDDNLCYILYDDEACTNSLGSTVWLDWGPTAKIYLDQYSSQRLRPIIPFCGPVQPPPSAIILKIRAMEKRRKQYA